jgi:hypothetical protein
VSTEEIERVHYYERQYLTAADFRAEQAYHRDMRRRHNLAHHTWGIVVGLELVEKTEGQTLSVYVQPGMAVDGYGREIIVRSPYKLDPMLFDRFNTLAHRQVWISYDESDALPPAFGFDVCEVENTLRRTVEGWRIEIDPGTHTRDDVIVDGRVIGPPPTAPVPGELYLPPDLSAPYQELPADDVTDRLWLVRLGTVQWDGPNQRFVAAAAGRLNESRSHVGAVAAQLLAPGQALSIKPRLAALETTAKEFAKVEGPLRVTGRLVAEQDVHVDGGVVRLNYAGGDTDSVDLWLGRRRGPADAGHLLRVHLGDDPSASTTKLTVGPGVGTDEKTVLAVRADDAVEVPTGTLRFGAQVRQMIDLWGATGPGKAPYGIGIQAGTLYQRTGSQFCWFRGGGHKDSGGEPGDNGFLQMQLDHSGRLLLEALTHKQGLHLHGAAFGLGTQPNTLYQRSPGNFAWYRGGTESPTDLDAGGGALAMKLSSGGALTVLGNTFITSNLVVGSGGNGFVKTRHINGKSWASDADDDLYLNWSTGKDVVVGQPGVGSTSDLVVAGNLVVHGSSDTAFRVRGYEVRHRNDQGSWSVSVSADFTQVFAAFAVLQGFSLWDNGNVTAFNNYGHSANADHIVQHCYVRVTGWTNSSVSGVAFCQEADPSVQSDNTVLFTVVVIGRKV